MANLSKDKRDRLLQALDDIRVGLSDDYLRSIVNEVELELLEKKYGLIWERHTEHVDEKMLTHIPVFTESKEREICNRHDLPVNFLLEGDNLHSLKLLEKTHRGEIDLIYIDPPYNTGNEDFIYGDTYIDSSDTFRHSKWISFMAERLSIAKKLLSPRGVIFIQISDIELAQLKLLCDDIFGENNFLNIISVNMKTGAGASGGGEDKRFKKNCEYILIYAKDYSQLIMFNGPFVYTEMYSVIEQNKKDGKSWHYLSVLMDAGKKEYVGSTVDGDGKEIKIYKRLGALVKSIKQVARDEGISEKEVYYKYSDRIFEAKDAQSSIRSRVTDAKKELGIIDDIISIEYIPKTGKNKGIVYEQFYKGSKCRLFAWLRDISVMIEGVLYKKELQGTYWDMTSMINNLSKEGNVEFSNGKKPVDLLKQIIKIYPSSDITVLDFFAGSGTTGHAVIALNHEEKQQAIQNGENPDMVGNRSFILCTNNEISNKQRLAYLHDKGILLDYTPKNVETNSTVGSKIKKYFEDKPDEFIELFETHSADVEEYGICRYFTYRRLKNVICGYTTESGKAFPPIPANLKYYLTDFVERSPIEDDLPELLMRHIKEMVQLEYGVYIDDQRFRIAFSDDDVDLFTEDPTQLDDCLILFYDSTILFTSAQKILLDHKGIKLIPIPEYYFDVELREAGEL